MESGKSITVTGTAFVDLPTDSSAYQVFNGTVVYAKHSKQIVDFKKSMSSLLHILKYNKIESYNRGISFSSIITSIWNQITIYNVSAIVGGLLSAFLDIIYQMIFEHKKIQTLD